MGKRRNINEDTLHLWREGLFKRHACGISKSERASPIEVNH